MAKRPSKLYYGPYVITIEYRDEPLVVDKAETYAWADGSQLLVIISTRYPEVHIRASVFHELLHALESITGFKHFDFSDEEARVRYLEHVLFPILCERRNWPVLDYIAGRDAE